MTPTKSTVVDLPSFDSLVDYVRQTLCDHDKLDPGQTPLSRACLRRQGRVCGMIFELEGPRLLRTYAIWAGDEQRLLFYDSTGKRFAEVRLGDGPDPALVLS